MFAGFLQSRIEPFEYVRQLQIALSAADVGRRLLLPDFWIAAHPEHFLQYRRDEAEAAARARKRRREKRRDGSRARLPAGLSRASPWVDRTSRSAQSTCPDRPRYLAGERAQTSNPTQEGPSVVPAAGFSWASAFGIGVARERFR
jgi:hypothetical protein